jgi:uncharacterized protein
MHYHIILTERCNSRCRYCYEKSMAEFDNGLEKKWDFDETPVDSSVDVEKLKKFLNSGDTLIFYGGEPLVKIDKVKEIINGLKNLEVKFYMQTNGKLLDKLDFEYLKKIEKMLVSIDGDKERTDFNKGRGTYDLVVKNVRDLREKGYSGEIVARMVVSPLVSVSEKTGADLYEQVRHLLGLGLFDSIHWQIDAGFYKNDFNFKDFSKFIEEYNKSVDRLLDYWVSLISSGEIVKIYPFIGILNRLRGWDKETRLPCGSGYSNFTITTNGNLVACPIMASVKNFYCGSLDKGVKKEINVQDCSSCSYFPICGGRCLYWREAKLWPREGDELICKTIKHLIDSIKSKTKGLDLKKEDVEYEKYFGPEIIP